MENIKNDFQSTLLVMGKNFECFKKICIHLKEQLKLVSEGPNKRKYVKNFLDASFKGHEDSDQIRKIHISFNNDDCQMIMEFHSTTGILFGRNYDMCKFDEDMLTKIRMATREWIYDGTY
ncbi:MAG: hypothetical protein NT068_01505 [Candidatus Nomurabacteria bacterium]|nr:hypothetical protein [Candidatus Nomurabacteria bacterium]